ncbi:MAG TPA: SGNH/GDSL hydrolase family protein, partial [Candidatus Limnocylindrales bacterium]|nr:SGNH/GDSL hydrolase family protein [Candidatus Limnocylindrales bacterium]
MTSIVAIGLLGVGAFGLRPAAAAGPPAATTVAPTMPAALASIDPPPRPVDIARQAPACSERLQPADLRTVGSGRSRAAPESPAVRSRASAHRTVPRTRAVAAFLGDSYTSGYNGAGYGGSGWPAIVSAKLGLRRLNVAVPGTGFVNPGWTGQPIRTRVAAVIRASPRIVFLAAGHNDQRFATSVTHAAAIAVIERLHRALPASKLVVIGPIWSGNRPPQSLFVLRDALRREASSVGAVFIDPIAGGWLAGSSIRYIGPDGLHPTNAG